jgi:hypothetical protein
MINAEETHIVKILNTKKYVIFINAYIILGVILTGLLTWHYRKIEVAWIGGFTFLLIPVLAKSHLQKPFNRIASFRFNEAGICIQFHCAGGTARQDHIRIRFVDLRAYEYDDGIGKCYFRFFFRNGKEKSFDFQDRIKDEVYIIDKIIQHIKKHNGLLGGDDKITKKLSFIASRKGLFFILALGFGWMVICIYLATHHIKAVPFTTIGGILFFIQIIIHRKRELTNYKQEELR